jgi:hypothetical protein
MLNFELDSEQEFELDLDSKVLSLLFYPLGNSLDPIITLLHGVTLATIISSSSSLPWLMSNQKSPNCRVDEFLNLLPFTIIK